MKINENVWRVRVTWSGILCLLFLCFCAAGNLYAQKSYSLETVPNVRLDDGDNRVSNPDDILSEAYVDSINHVLRVMEDSTGIEVAVVAVTSIGDNDVRLFASDLFNRWGIGKKGKDNGLLILMVTEKGHRTIVFETGYGLEGDLPDATCYSIQQKYMLPDLKQGNYDVGMLKGVRALSDLLYGGSIVPAEDDSIDGEGLFYALILLAITGVIYCFLFILVPLFFFNIFIGLFGRLLINIWPRTCPKCGKRKLRLKRTEVVKKPTFKQKGLYRLHFACKHCGHEKVVDQHMNKYGLFCFIDLYVPNLGSSSSSSPDFAGFNMDKDSDSWGEGSSGGGGSSSDFDE